MPLSDTSSPISYSPDRNNSPPNSPESNPKGNKLSVRDVLSSGNSPALEHSLQMLEMWMNGIKGDEHVPNNAHRMMDVLCASWLEFRYAQDKHKEEETRLYDQDEFLSRFCENNIYSFIESLRNCEKSEKLLNYLQDEQLNQIRLRDYHSSNRFIHARSEMIKALHIFELGTLMYYVSELKDMRKAFDYTLWYFKNSSLYMNKNFVDILMAVLDSLICFNFNTVLNATEHLYPNLFRGDPISDDDMDPLIDYFVLKKNQSISCVRRLIFANESIQYPIDKNILFDIENSIRDDFSTISDTIEIYSQNTDRFERDISKLIEKLKGTISLKWDSSWDYNMSSKFINSSMPLLKSPLQTLKSRITARAIENQKTEEWMNAFPRLNLFDEMSNIDERPDNKTWASGIGSDFIDLMDTIQLSLCGLNSIMKISSEVSKKQMESIKSQNESQNSSNSVHSPQTPFDDPMIDQTPIIQSNNSLGHVRNEHPTQSKQPNKKIKK